MEKLISVVTPCYNGEFYLDRYFNSLLKQTYINFEVIFVNDGSTDKTEEIALKYKKIFEKKNINFIYLYQDNAGQSVAVEKGLKYIKGEFLTWPDSDDFYEENALEKMSMFLIQNQDYSMVRTKANIVDESNLNEIIGHLEPSKKNKYKSDLFLDYILQNDVYFAPICFMINVKFLKISNSKLELFHSRAGQNWQMLLPVLYRQKCGFIDEYLCNYVVRDKSHSHSKKKLNEILDYYNLQEEIIIETIKKISNIDNKEYYFDLVKNKYIRFKYNLFLDNFNYKEAKKYFKILKKKKILKFNDIIVYIKSKFRWRFKHE